jgi:mitogen-activated protein kinase 15
MLRPQAGRVFVLPISDNTKYTVAEYRDRLYGEILKKKREMMRLIKEKVCVVYRHRPCCAQFLIGVGRAHAAGTHPHGVMQKVVGVMAVL